MDSKIDMTDALQLLKWQLELGVDENVGNVPLNRFSELVMVTCLKYSILSRGSFEVSMLVMSTEPP